MTTAIVLGGGRGARLGGGEPKALRPLGDRLLISYSLQTAAACRDIAHVVVVAPAGHEDVLRREIARLGIEKVHALVANGPERQDSVSNALAACPPGTRHVAVHDAARPFATARLFAAVIAVARESGAAIAALPARDTLKRCVGRRVVETPERSTMWHAQTPQVFRADWLTVALAECAARGTHVTDDAEAVALLGHPVLVVPGEEDNFKIATPHDWRRAELLLRERGEGPGPAP